MNRSASDTHEPPADYALLDIGELALEGGGTIPSCQLAVATWGTPNEARDNTVLLPTWFGGTHKRWSGHIGPDHALDPRRYFIVAINQLGNGLSTSPHTTDDERIALSRFPALTIGDDVTAGERVLREHFGIEEFFAVVGGSMGARLVYEWAVRFPDRVHRAAPIAGTAQDTARTRVWVPAGLTRNWWQWQGPAYAMQAHVMASMFGVQFDMDRIAMGTLHDKWQAGDVTRHANGDLRATLGRIRAKTFVLAVNNDTLFPVSDCRAEQQLIRDSELRVIDDPAGHFALFGLNPGYLQQVDHHLSELFAA